jgi:uncharacterized protein (TIGR03000 family)
VAGNLFFWQEVHPMYSVVLMMALTATTDTPDLGRRGGGCCGCYGGGRHSRRGGGCCGCYGGGYGGCYGGCYGGGYGGCYGGCYGMGCMGGGYGGCYGMSSGGCYGGAYGGMPYTTTVIKQEQLKKTPKPKDEEVSVPTPATIVVSLPANAKLTIDKDATTQTGSQRVFASPALAPGREYHYTLEARFEQEGKPIVLKQEVAVRAGMTTPVSFTAPTSVAKR